AHHRGARRLGQPRRRPGACREFLEGVPQEPLRLACPSFLGVARRFRDGPPPEPPPTFRVGVDGRRRAMRSILWTKAGALGGLGVLALSACNGGTTVVGGE